MMDGSSPSVRSSSSSSACAKTPGKNRTGSFRIDLPNLTKKRDFREASYGDNRVNVCFRNISYSVKEGLFKGRKRELLNNVSGEFNSSELTAIMGPSGAGKSTLMNILAGYTTHGVTGQIYTNGHVRDESSFRKQSCYIMQDDNLQPLLTVAEAMTVAANLKLSNRIDSKEKDNKVKEILISLDLWTRRKIQTTCLSGGEKKRLSIALELLTDPQVMFFDEPTSGLDIVSSKQCISLLKRLTTLHRTIICTIHQPSARILDLFDHLYVVANGLCMYQGSVKRLLPYLEDIQLYCPKFHNPADFLLEVLNGDHGNHNEVLLQKSENGLTQQWRHRTISFEKEGNCHKLTTDLKLMPFRKVNTFLNKNLCLCRNRYSTSFPYQVLVLVKRTFLIISRDKTLTYNRLSTHLLIAVFIGFLYFGIGRDAADMLNNFKFLFFSVMFLMLTSFNCVTTTFPSELPIIAREHFNKWYSLKSYYLAVTFADIPVQIVATLIYGSVTYFLTRQPVESHRIFSFLFMCVLISLVAQSFGLLIGACMDVKNGVIFGPFCLLPFTIFSGFFVQMNACHPSMRWLFHISFLKYGFEGLVLSVLGYNRPKLPCNADYCHYVQPETFLANMDMQKSAYSLSVIFLFGLFLLIRISAYFVLKLQVRSRCSK